MLREKKLNKQQLQAVKHGHGPLLIIAGAGTGKTTVITERIKRLISQELALPGEILALTFTEKAAREMEERIDTALPYGYTQMWVMTFHSFCDRLLRDAGVHIGLNTNYKLITDTDIVSLLRRHIFDFKLDYFRPLGNPNKFISGMLGHFNRLRDEDISPEQYLTWTHKHSSKKTSPEDILDRQQYLELATVYNQYQNLKIKENSLDFADLITYSLRLFRSRPNILKTYQQKFKYILVDEYQDTNYAQNQLVNLLADKSHNLTVVADDDQSIYRWRGAAVSNVIQFKHIYPRAKTVVLTQNFRSNQKILDCAYKLIQFNNPDRLEVKENINKRLKAVSEFSDFPVEYLHFDRGENEAEGVAKKIGELLEASTPSITPRDCAILVRANAHAQAFSRALFRRGIPYQFLGPGRLFEQPEVKDLIAYLQVLRDYADDQALFRVLSMDFFKIPVKDLVILTSYARKHNLSLFSACQQADKTDLPASSRKKVDTVVLMMNRHTELLLKESAGQLLFYFLQDSGMLSAILSYQLPIDEHKADNITKFFNKLKSFESENSDASVQSVLDWIDLSYEVGESPAATDTDWTQNNAVNILTIHSAKGLEFPVVFLVNLVSQRFPTSEKSEPIPIPHKLIKEVLPQGDYHLQEERRLFYVGMTRAKIRLFFTASDFYGEGKRSRKISPFISEALGESISRQQMNDRVKQPSLLDWKQPDFTFSVSDKNHQSQVRIDYLSYSQIQTYIDCPLHYRAKYILKIPSPSTAASSFGNTIHKTLKEYHDNLINTPGKPDILKIYARNWIPEGYHNARHAQLYFTKGESFLKKYLQTGLSESQPISLEEPFTVPVGKLKIGGKIDRVDLLPDGKIEIIDYKTSTHALTEKQAQKDLQLSFYALAANLIRYPPFNKKPEDIILTLYYLEDQKKISVIHDEKQLKSAREQIFDYAHQIENSDFNCSGSLICQRHCDYRVLCDINRNT